MRVPMRRSLVAVSIVAIMGVGGRAFSSDRPPEPSPGLPAVTAPTPVMQVAPSPAAAALPASGLRLPDWEKAASMLRSLIGSEVDGRVTFSRAEQAVEAIFRDERYGRLLRELSDSRMYDPEQTRASRRSIRKGISSCRRPDHVDPDRYARCSGMVDRLISYASEFARTADSTESALSRAFERAARLLRSAAANDGLSLRSLDRPSKFVTVELWAGTVHGWPGFGPSLPGLYSWPVRDGARSWMHKVPRDYAAVAPDSVELTFHGGVAEQVARPIHANGVSDRVTTETRLLDVDGTPVTIRLDWFPATDPDLIDEARAVIDSIVVETTDSGHRLVFRLPGDWDSG